MWLKGTQSTFHTLTPYTGNRTRLVVASRIHKRFPTNKIQVRFIQMHVTVSARAFKIVSREIKMGDSLIIDFLVNYWKQVLGATLPLLVLYLIQFFSSKRQDGPRDGQTKPTQLPEEHPLAEFRDARSSEGDRLLSPALHAEDTEHIPYVHISRTEEEMIQRSQEFYQLMNSRRSVRMFSNQPVPIEVIKNIVHAAGTSPSGMCHVTVVNSDTQFLALA